MGRNWLLRLAGVMLVAAALCAAQAPAGGAFLAGPGTRDAYLNGQALLPGTAILPGETVTTGGGGIAVLTPTGTSGGAIELTGNASATVAPPVAGRPGAPLSITHGDALIYGQVSILTPQGATLLPQSGTTSYVVNVAPAQSSLGVLTGSVRTLHSTGDLSVTQGQARSWNAGGQMNTIALAQVTRPKPDSAMQKLVAASVSR